MKTLIKKPQIAIYQVVGDGQKIQVRIEGENVLDEKSVIRNFRITASVGIN